VGEGKEEGTEGAVSPPPPRVVHLRGQQTTDGRGVAAETGAPASTWKWKAAAVSARGGPWLGRPPRHPDRRIRRVGHDLRGAEAVFRGFLDAARGPVEAGGRAQAWRRDGDAFASGTWSLDHWTVTLQESKIGALDSIKSLIDLLLKF